MIEKDAYPITITLRHNRENGGGQACNGDARNGEHAESEGLEIVKAKYLVGTDGAKSWTRKQLDIPLEGNQTDSVWGVMDVIPLTDFRKSLLGLNIPLLLTALSRHSPIMCYSFSKIWQYLEYPSREQTESLVHPTEQRQQG
jgi:2-polyprenyl-6-methoxyphenol hydroxylase-like FAD-dependent oxidoreductase